jgi:hypothetical protein
MLLNRLEEDDKVEMAEEEGEEKSRGLPKLSGHDEEREDS